MVNHEVEKPDPEVEKREESGKSRKV